MCLFPKHITLLKSERYLVSERVRKDIQERTTSSDKIIPKYDKKKMKL